MQKKTLLLFVTFFSIFFASNAQPAPSNALNFTGSSSYVEGGDIDNGITAYTIETWLKWDPIVTNEVGFICGKAVEQFELHTGGMAGHNGLRFIPTGGVWLDVFDVLPVGTWTHIAAVYDPANSYAKIYINGVDVPLTISNGNLAIPMVNTTYPLRLGLRGNSTLPLNGALDEFRIWNRVRTQTEIISDMHYSILPEQNGLVTYYNFNIGIPSGNNAGLTTLPDLTGNYNATLVGFTLNGTTSNFVAGISTYRQVVPVSMWGIAALFLLIGTVVLFRFYKHKKMRPLIGV